jgi:hypothetical protein
LKEVKRGNVMLLWLRTFQLAGSVFFLMLLGHWVDKMLEISRISSPIRNEIQNILGHESRGLGIGGID